MTEEKRNEDAPFSKKNMGADKTLNVASGINLSVRKLSSLKHQALRRRVWFRCLSRIERGIIDLTVQCVDSIKSGKLATIVTAIIHKLDTAMEGMVDRLVRTVGVPLAQKISNIAVKLGNFSAGKWATDKMFARFLAVMSLNG